MVSFIIMKEGSYSEPAIFDVIKCCVVACKRNHFDFLNSCKPLQNIVNVEALYATMVLYVGYSKEPSH